MGSLGSGATKVLEERQREFYSGDCSRQSVIVGRIMYFNGETGVAKFRCRWLEVDRGFVDCYC